MNCITACLIFQIKNENGKKSIANIKCGKLLKMENDLSQVVIDLHNLARVVEHQIGVGTLSKDIRNCADRLTTLINPVIIDYTEEIIRKANNERIVG